MAGKMTDQSDPPDPNLRCAAAPPSVDRTGSAADRAGRGDATSATCFRKRSSSGLVLEKAACACVMKFVMKFIKKRVRNQSFCYISIFICPHLLL